MSGVTALITSTGGNVTGDVTLASTQPGILTVSNNPTAPYTINFSPVSATVNTLNGKIGALTLGSDYQSYVTSPINGDITVTPYVPATGTATDATLTAPALGTALAWNTANAYVPGNVVINSGTTYVCLVAQPASSSAPTDGANWQSIGGGVGGGSITAGGASVVCDNPSGSGSITVTTNGLTGDLNIDTTAGVGNVEIKTGGNLSFDVTHLDGNVDMIGSSTNFHMDKSTSQGGLGAIYMTSSSVGNARLQVGGNANPTGLWVGATALSFNGNPIGVSGNWSYKGTFNTTVATAYALNDVVFDTVITSQTYVCIIGYTTTVPSPQPPSANATNWKQLATTASTSNTITNAGASLSIDTTGTLTYTTPDTPLFVNQINMTTTIPTTTPALNAGQINISAGSTASFTAVGDTVISAQDGYVTLSRTATTAPVGGVVKVEPGNNAVAGYAIYYCGGWVNLNSYSPGAVVYDPTQPAPVVAPYNLWLCSAFVVGSGATIAPHQDTTNAYWRPFYFGA